MRSRPGRVRGRRPARIGADADILVVEPGASRAVGPMAVESGPAPTAQNSSPSGGTAITPRTARPRHQADAMAHSGRP